ncbi:MAG: PIN domain-containing protein [Firmicutes bacterium]|nr:PIN domain-containing protein [Bacillota bacterium]
MKQPVFVDTSGWCAVFDRSDRHHPEAKRYWESLAGTLGLLYTSDFVLAETLTLLRMRLGHADAVRFGRQVLASKVVRIVPVSSSHWQEAWTLFVRSPGKDLSFTDCTSFALMRDLSVQAALTVILPRWGSQLSHRSHLCHEDAA